MANKEPLAISAALGKLLQDLGIRRKLREYDVITLWDQIVGEQIAKVATAQRIEKGVLFVEVASAPWRAELSMRRRDIIERINTIVGKKVVLEVRFR